MWRLLFIEKNYQNNKLTYILKLEKLKREQKKKKDVLMVVNRLKGEKKLFKLNLNFTSLNLPKLNKQTQM